MALMLRKMCQPVLDDYDLDAYHADLNPKDKSLQLYTPCGKEFALVSGVRFGSLNPTKLEMEYARELLGDWLLRNKGTIEEFISLFETLQRTPWPADTDEFTVTTRQTWDNGKWMHVPNGLEITHQGITYTVDVKTKHIYSINVGEIPVDTTIHLPAEVFKRGQQFHAEVMANRKANKAVENMLAELNTCSS